MSRNIAARAAYPEIRKAMEGNALAFVDDEMPMSDEDLVTEMVMALVDHPDRVRIEAVSKTRQQTDLMIHTDPSDYGRVVGKNGRTVEAMRAFMGIVGGRHGRRITIAIADGRHRGQRPAVQRRREPPMPVVLRRHG